MERPVLLIRPEDLIWLEISFDNLVLDTSGQMPVLRRADEAQDAHLVLELPAQAVAEEAFYFDKLEPPPASGEFPTWPPARTILASPTRLVFRVPPEVPTIQYSPEGILAILSSCRLAVARVARSDLPPGEPAEPTNPGALETAIEAPYRLVLSPDQCAAWEHSAKPVTHGERTELWHTRLGFRPPQEGDEDAACVPTETPNIRAIWSQDAPGAYEPLEDVCPPPIKEPGEQTLRPVVHDAMLNSLWPALRWELARLTTTRNTPDPASEYSAPLAARQVILSSLGAWLDLYGEWRYPSPVARFEHRATLGREQYTRVELRGFYWPLGHRATIVVLTERRLRPDPDQVPPIAYLVQEMSIETAEPIKYYAPEVSPSGGRQFPFQSVRIVTERTPRIPHDDVPTEHSFWIRLGGSDFMFAVEGVDGDGNTIRWQMPLAFVCQQAMVEDFIKLETEFTGERSRRPLNGQRLAYVAESQAGAGQASGKTSLTTQHFTFATAAPAVADPAAPSFLPVMASAEVLVPAIQYLTRDGLGVQTIRYFQGFLEQGLKPELGEVFAEFVQPPGGALPGLDMPPELGGGLANLRPQFAGLSRELGPIGQLPLLVPGTTDIVPPDPLEMLRESELLGGIKIRDIVELPNWGDLAPSEPGLPSVPKIPGLTVTYDDPRDPKLVTATLQFKPNVRDRDLGFLEFYASALPPGAEDGPGPAAVLELVAETQIRRDGSAPTTQVRGTLTDFVLRIKDVVELRFERFGFLSRGGEKPDVSVGLRKVTFLGALAFVDQLTKFIEPAGFSDPPSLEVTPDGLMLAYSTTLPPIPVGIFSLENISLGASLFLPLFGGRPFAVGFQFARRHSKFRVGIAPFAGGGFFGIVVSARGVQEIEAGIEFGGSLSLNLGVASGGVSVMAGIDFKLENTSTGTRSALTGYFRANGALEVLGIVRISLEIYIGLTVQFKTAENSKIIIHGEARIVLEVSVLFFSASVTLSVERSFDGPDPGFAENMPLPAWKRYSLAFA
ncbi:hypothetical protein [Nannocystis punicea]|uniref:Uncharacterized protein n=1 Tax=Nannocystis punicea TaxID=2995304 RepID=A0ABY7GXE7_9BACT|nr:hypothetical protein [Nannocystis poenicansa]WAS91570.1 hypothetical protein O0S08_35770 [Nannocystis poenicansa]